MGGAAVRWVMLRGNTFTNNYINPQIGNDIGGTIQFDPCAVKVYIIGNNLTGPSTFLQTDGMELYSRELLIDGNTVSDYPLEGITLNSVYDATVTNNIVTNNGIPSAQGGILLSTAESVTGPCGDPRDADSITITGNTSTGQPYGIYLHDHDRHSRNTLRAVTIGNNTLTPNSIGMVGIDSIVTVSQYSGPATTQSPSQSGPRALTVKAVSPVTTRCSTPGSQRETFTFPASDARGTSSVEWIQGIFSIGGADSDGAGGPDSGAQGCHFIYYRAANTLYVDGPSGNSNWIGSSVVGAGGADISNGYCTVHASSSQVTAEPYIVNLTIDIDFPFSSTSSMKKHIYSITGDYQNQTSDGGEWKYWGWWSTP
jgi:parallel beta-helix repeat protein